MRFARITVGIGLALALAAGASAHPNHEHKLMGTVTAVDEEKIEIKTKDGETISIPLTPKTAYKRGEEAAKPTDVAVGGRVVVLLHAGRGQGEERDQGHASRGEGRRKPAVRSVSPQRMQPELPWKVAHPRNGVIPCSRR